MRRASDTDALLDLMYTMLKAQLEALDSFRSMRANRGKPVGKPERITQTGRAYEVLLQAGQPLHILEIVRRIREAYDMPVTRDILVSGILKKVGKRELFVKVGKNTYGLLGRD